MKIAADKNLDLVKIAPQANPPACKIMDYGKYRFEQSKREKEAKKHQKQVETKEIRMSLNIDKHDLDTKINHTIKFLNGGDKVKVSIRFRGRELAHTNLGYPLLESFKIACQEAGNIDKDPKMEGRSLVMFLSPKGSK